MSKRAASEADLAEPDQKKVHTEDNQPASETSEEVTEKTEEKATEDAVSKTEKSAPQTILRLLMPTSLGDALEDTENKILSPGGNEAITVSEKIRGAPDRVLVLRATTDQLAILVANAAEYIAKANWGKHTPESQPAAPVSNKKGRGKNTAAQQQQQEKDEMAGREYSTRVLVPDHVVVGALKPGFGSGKKGELTTIENESKAKLELSRSQLPASTDRSLLVRGSLDELKAAIKSLAEVITSQDESAAYFPMIPYVPRVVTGIYGHPETFQRQMLNQTLAATNPYLIPAADMANGPIPAGESAGAAPHQEQLATAIPTPVVGGDVTHMATQGGMQQAQMQAQAAVPGSQLTQQIYIPNDMVGAIIGKGGTKINEIRQSSGSMIRINEANEETGGAGGPTGPGGSERMVTIIGTPESNQMALYLLYQRIENERHHHKK